MAHYSSQLNAAPPTCGCHHMPLDVLSNSYVSLSVHAELEPELVNWLNGGKPLLALNRYERKKNIGLAIRSLAEVIHRHALSSGACAQCRLVVAGGHDPRIAENVQHSRELRALAEELGVEDRVVFLRNVTDSQRCGLPALLLGSCCFVVVWVMSGCREWLACMCICIAHGLACGEGDQSLCAAVNRACA